MISFVRVKDCRIQGRFFIATALASLPVEIELDLTTKDSCSGPVWEGRHVANEALIEGMRQHIDDGRVDFDRLFIPECDGGFFILVRLKPYSHR